MLEVFSFLYKPLSVTRDKNVWPELSVFYFQLDLLILESSVDFIQAGQCLEIHWIFIGKDWNIF
jgi:hypothetical protein